MSIRNKISSLKEKVREKQVEITFICMIAFAFTQVALPPDVEKSRDGKFSITTPAYNFYRSNVQNIAEEYCQNQGKSIGSWKKTNALSDNTKSYLAKFVFTCEGAPK